MLIMSELGDLLHSRPQFCKAKLNQLKVNQEHLVEVQGV